MRKIISLFARVGISAGILFFLLKQIDLGKTIQVISQTNKPVLIFAWLLFLLTYIIGFLRWKMLLKGLGLRLGHSLILRSFCLGYFCNLFFPSTIGGDLLRSVDLGLRTQKPRHVAASVILDRLSGYSALVIVALIALLLGHRIVMDKAVFLAIGIISAILTAILALLFNNFLFSKTARLLRFAGSIGQALVNLHYEIYNFRSQKKIIVKNFIYSLMIQLILPLFVYLVSSSLGIRINPLYFFILVPIINIIAALPVSIAGLGLREASSVYFFTRVGMPSEVALAISFLSFLIIFFFGLSAGLIYMFSFSRLNRKRLP